MSPSSTCRDVHSSKCCLPTAPQQHMLSPSRHPSPRAVELWSVECGSGSGTVMQSGQVRLPNHAIDTPLTLNATALAPSASWAAGDKGWSGQLELVAVLAPVPTPGTSSYTCYHRTTSYHRHDLHLLQLLVLVLRQVLATAPAYSLSVCCLSACLPLCSNWCCSAPCSGLDRP